MAGKETVNESMHWPELSLDRREPLFFVGTRTAHLVNGRSLYTAFRLNVLMLLFDCCLDQTCSIAAFRLNVLMLFLDLCASIIKIFSFCETPG